MDLRLIFLVLALVQRQAISEKVCLGESDPRGAQYQGKLQRSHSGKRCIDWRIANSATGITWVQNPSRNRNYCRNPEGGNEKPWCYVTHNTWEFCNVKDCNDMCGAQTIVPSFSNQQYYVREGQLLPRGRVKRVIGGDVATHGSWPWVVSVRLAKNGPHYCGGALIRKSWVLTAAHCVDSHVDISRMGVYAGHHYGTEAETQIRGIKRIIVHPYYSADLVTKDIALVQLQAPFKMSNHVRVACLPSPDHIVPSGTYCISAGWGYNGDRSQPKQLKQVVLRVNSYKFCRQEMGRDMEDRTQMCAGWKGRRHGTCSGDSGGPLFCLGAQSHRWTIQGINSWSLSLCDHGTGGIEAYTRVSKFVRWIKQQIAENS